MEGQVKFVDALTKQKIELLEQSNQQKDKEIADLTKKLQELNLSYSEIASKNNSTRHKSNQMEEEIKSLKEKFKKEIEYLTENHERAMNHLKASIKDAEEKSEIKILQISEVLTQKDIKIDDLQQQILVEREENVKMMSQNSQVYSRQIDNNYAIF